MSEHIFTEIEIEKLALAFLTQIRKRMKSKAVYKISGGNAFSELEDYLYYDVMGGCPILYIKSELVDVIPRLGIDKDEASLFASYISYCLLRRSDRDLIKIGLEPMYYMDLLFLYKKERCAFKIREEKRIRIRLIETIQEVVKQKAMKIAT